MTFSPKRTKLKMYESKLYIEIRYLIETQLHHYLKIDKNLD